MTAPAHRLPHAHQLSAEMLRRARRIMLVLMFPAAAGVGIVLALFVTPHLVPILGVLALVVLIVVIVQQTIGLCRADEEDGAR